MYILTRPREYALTLNTFHVTNEEGTRAEMGEELVSKGVVTLHLSVGASDDLPHPAEVRVIRAGEVIKTFSINTPFEMQFEDTPPASGKTFYRVDIIRDMGNLIITNPIFVRKENP